ncbi:MAG TPA: DUF4197 domain-containing protein [Pyrinomonadaceae bacterium]|nr:DUF4197 domain-containing protein [Pyrinomonadaceae bacterium]HQX55811.1 DUF4197 domain-containing protein [Pyrinomonadaceae bacterium]HQY66858.1 DUF4197 domain-containing protein [Pyrinomonadaceae bacterium]HRA41820.1 DUF4197 domain-containing protein [Pyrinomonadaceae bacterium]
MKIFYRSLMFVLLGTIFVSAAAAQRSTTKVSDNDIAGGLKEALSKGVGSAIKSLGKEDGFLGNVRVKIPLPNSLQKIEKVVRVAGQGKAVDEFVASMNHAAEKAVPVAVDVFVDAIKQMTFDDARNILFSKQSDSATQFFRKTSEETLREKFRPIVEEFTAKTGVTQKYKAMIGKAGFAAQFLGKDATDLDAYVTQKALDGLFLLVADEEKQIRKNPLGRTTSLLKKVFGVLR